MSNTELDILSSMGIEDNETTNETPEVSEQTEGRTEEPRQPEPVASSGGQQDSTSEQPQAQDTRAPEAPRLNADAKGNLVNERGQVVASAGRERRYFEQVQKNRELAERQSAYIRDLENRVREVEQAGSGTAALNGLPQQLGLNDNEAALGLRLIQSYKRDPVGTIKYILTEAAASGHNVNDLLGRDASGIDMNAIGRMIDQRLAPVTDRYSQEQAQLQARQAAERQINQFYARYPDAPTHEDVIGKMIASDPNLSLEGAYAQLLRVAQVHGLDFSQPLRPQLEAKQNATPQSSVGSTRSAPPSGRPVANNTMASEVTAVNSDMTYKDIIRQAMAGAGLDPSQY